MSDNPGDWKTVVVSDGITFESGSLNNIIDLEQQRLHLPDTNDTEDVDLTRSPPNTTPDMFPGLIGDLVDACCSESEAVPVAVAIHTLVRFAALVGPTVYLPIGDERRLLNEFALLVGPTGLGKGVSGHGPRRLFHRAEQCLELDLHNQFQAGRSEGIADYPWLQSHMGGLSSGEGLASALDDGDGDKSEPVNDKRMLVFEPEFSTVLAQAQRSGNTLSMVLRNGFDGVDIKPLTKRDKVRVSDPYLCLIGNITARELTCHDQTALMAANGMLNRFLILWQHPVRNVPFPEPMAGSLIDRFGQLLADRVLFARNGSHETHWKKVRQQCRRLSLDDDAQTYWQHHYAALVNRADCDQVTTLTRRHRLHALLIASLLALLDNRLVLGQGDIQSGLAWCEYSRQSVIYIFNSLAAQFEASHTHRLSRKVLLAIRQLSKDREQCRTTDIHLWFHNKLTRDHLQPALERLLTHVPPLIRQHRLSGRRGPPTFYYALTPAGEHALNFSHTTGVSLEESSIL